MYETDWTSVFPYWLTHPEQYVRTSIHYTINLWYDIMFGWPKTALWRTVEAEMKNMNHSWGAIQRLASDRQGWRSFVAALYTSWRDREWWWWWWWWWHHVTNMIHKRVHADWNCVTRYRTAYCALAVGHCAAHTRPRTAYCTLAAGHCAAHTQPRTAYSALTVGHCAAHTRPRIMHTCWTRSSAAGMRSCETHDPKQCKLAVQDQMMWLRTAYTCLWNHVTHTTQNSANLLCKTMWRKTPNSWHLLCKIAWHALQRTVQCTHAVREWVKHAT